MKRRKYDLPPIFHVPASTPFVAPAKCCGLTLIRASSLPGLSGMMTSHSCFVVLEEDMARDMDTARWLDLMGEWRLRWIARDVYLVKNMGTYELVLVYGEAGMAWMGYP